MMFARTALVALFLAVPIAEAAITCGPKDAIQMSGSSAVVDVATAWGKAYSAACGNTITVTSAGSTAGGGSIVGAQAVCGVGGSPVDVGLLSRQLISPTEATQNTNNPYLFTCSQGVVGRGLTQVQVAIDGLAFIAAPNGIAAKCLASLAGGGLTFSQVRWIYSSFSLAKLKSDPFFDGVNAVPNPDNNDNTHLWSELCKASSCNCPATEIGFAGSPTSSGVYLFFKEKVLTGNGETVRNGYKSDPNDSPSFVVNTVIGSSPTVGYTSFAPYNNNAKLLYAASVQDPDDAVWRLPTLAQFTTGEYPASFFVYMAVSNAILPAIRPFFAYAFSDAGNNDVLKTGLLPITNVGAVQMLTRLGAPGGVNPSSITCGPTGSIFQGGSSTVYPLEYIWGGVYGDQCGLSFTTLSGGSGFGAQLACGIADPVSKNIADIGSLSRNFAATEAALQQNGYDYKCIIGPNQRQVRQFPVAIDGITFAFPSNGNAAACLATLPGKGLTVDQLRWMYSSFTVAQLTANGWQASSLPNSDGNDGTHLWSELGGSGCPATEIAIAGSPSTAGTYSFFTGATFSGTGEGIALNRPTGYFNVLEDNPNEVVVYLQGAPASIGYFGFSYYAKNTDTLGAAPIKYKSGSYIVPSEGTFADGTYVPYTRQVFLELSTVYLTFQKTSAYVKFGITTSVGDTLTRYAGLTPLSTATKTSLTKRYTLDIPCFSETSTVQVMDKGVVAMKDLSIGDMVMNAQGKYDAVYSFGHYAPEVEAEFVQIHVSGLKTPLEISKEHMLFVEGVAVPASAVMVGDKVNLANTDGKLAEVKKIQTVVRHGAYAPFTNSGTIAVNNVAASVYVDLQNKAGVLMVGGYKTPLSMQFLAHMFQAPHRVACKISPSYCQTESYNDEGVSAWVAGPLALAEWVIQQNVVIMTLSFVPCFLLGVAIYMAELLMASKMLLLIAVASLLAVRSTKKSKKEV